jgi:hypothetical protein
MTRETPGCTHCAEFARELMALEPQVRAEVAAELSERPGPHLRRSKLRQLLMRALSFTARSNRRILRRSSRED